MTRFQELQGVSGIAWLLTRGVVRFSGKVRKKTDSRRMKFKWHFEVKTFIPLSRAGVRITERNRIFECSSSTLNWFDVMEVWQTIKYHSPRSCLNFWPRAVFCFSSTEFEGRSSRINWLLTEWVERRLTIHPPHFPSGLFRDRWRSLLFIISQGELSTDDGKPLQGRS